MSIIQPEWVYRIIAGLTEYEDTHPNPRYDGGICLMNLLDLVPKDVRRDAALFMEGVRRAEASCSCPVIETTPLDQAEPTYTRGNPFGCPVHGGELDPGVKKAIEEARAA